MKVHEENHDRDLTAVVFLLGRKLEVTTYSESEDTFTYKKRGRG